MNFPKGLVRDGAHPELSGSITPESSNRRTKRNHSPDGNFESCLNLKILSSQIISAEFLGYYKAPDPSFPTPPKPAVISVYFTYTPFFRRLTVFFFRKLKVV